MSLTAFVKWWKELAVVFCIIVAVTAWHDRDKALVEKGKAQERSRVADSALSVLRPQLIRADTVVVHDTKVVTHTLTKLDTLRDSIIAHRTDTLFLTRYIAQVDTAKKVCSDLANSCEVFRQTANATIAALNSKLSVVPKPQSCGRVCGVLLGVGGTLLLRKAMR